MSSPLPSGNERAILVHIFFGAHSPQEEDLTEFEELARSAGATVVDVITSTRPIPCPKLFIGSGKAEEVSQAIAHHEASIVLVNHALSPAQERNLERLWGCRVLDRIGLILDIFALRARTFEGKLQVELAQLQHLSTRLVRGWTHLERQKGGIGLRGPGETQLETDRRLVRNRIATILSRLDKVKAQRQQNRNARTKAGLATVALVGYTNAGKSTLFNQLVHTDNYAADLLFATLDPSLRKLYLPHYGDLILTDTVGFIRHLPHELVAAFQATLEETRQANLLLHVIDLHNEHQLAQLAQVEEVLAEIGAAHVPVLYVYNKIDLLPDVTPRIQYDADGSAHSVFISAQKGLGLELLMQAIVTRLSGQLITEILSFPAHAGKLRALLYAQDAIVEESHDADGGWLLTVKLPQQQLDTLKQNLAKIA